MLYVFYGTDTVGVRERAHTFLAEHEADGVVVDRVTPELVTEGMLRDLAGATSLFGTQKIILLDTPSEKKDVFEEVLSDAEMLGDSGNIFVLIEAKLLAPERRKLEKYAKECIEVTAPGTERFNTFSFADALAKRDKKLLWILYAKALREGIPPEEIIGVLFWQIKAIRLAKKTKSAEEAGMKQFSYKKAQSVATKFTDEEVNELSRKLISVYHDGHGGKRDIDIALEQFLLTV